MSERNLNVWATVGFGIGFSASTGLGFVAGNIYDNVEQSRVGNEVTHLTARSGEMDEANRNLSRTQTRLGEQCLSALTIYMPENTLATTKADSVVDDLRNDPTAPCGTKPTDIRGSYASLRQTHEEYGKSKDALEHARAELKSHEQKATDPDTPEMMASGAIFGLLVGTFGAYQARYKAKRGYFNF